MKKKILIIPVEIFARELSAKLLIARYAIENNFIVYLGTHTSIQLLLNSKKYKSGVIICKGGVSKNYLKLIKKKISYHIVLDEELAPERDNYKNNIEFRFDLENKKNISYFFVLNKKIKKIAEKVFLKYRTKVYSFGWPRFDFYEKTINKLFKTEVNQIKKKYKKFILINSDFFYTDFGSKNELNKEIRKLRKISKDYSNSKKQINEMIFLEKKRFKSLKNDFKLFINKIKEFSKVSKSKIILRSHPAENEDNYKKIFSNFDNVIVKAGKDDVTPYIIASEGVLHRGCTTGYQAILLRKKIGFIKLGRYTNSAFNYKKILLKQSRKIDNANDFINWNKNKKNLMSLVKFSKEIKQELNIDYKKSSQKIIKFIKTLNIQNETTLNINYLKYLKLYIINIFEFISKKNKFEKNNFFLKEYDFKERILSFSKLDSTKLNVRYLTKNLVELSYD